MTTQKLRPLGKQRNATVCTGFLSPGEVRHEFLDSMVGMMRYYSENSRKVIRGHASIQSGPRVAEGRSQLVDAFATSNCDWLLMIDSDMVWEPDALDRLLTTAYKRDARIVGGLCFGGRGDNHIFPTVYRLIEEDDMMMTEPVYDYPRDAEMIVGATGAAFLLIHKSVFAVMKQKFGKLANGRPNPYPWFVEASNGGRPFGEDIAFCIKAKACGFDVWVNTEVKVGHMKTHELSEIKYEAQQAATVEAKPALILPDSP